MDLNAIAKGKAIGQEREKEREPEQNRERESSMPAWTNDLSEHTFFSLHCLPVPVLVPVGHFYCTIINKSAKILMHFFITIIVDTIKQKLLIFKDFRAKIDKRKF